MYLETIRQISQVEDAMDKAKADAKADAQKRLADAQKAGQALLTRAQQEADAENAALLRQAEENAGARRDDILQTAQKDCDALKLRADGQMNEAVATIVRKVVEHSCPSQK